MDIPYGKTFLFVLKFWSSDLDLQLRPTFEKLNLGINFCNERDPKVLQKFGRGY